MTVGFYEIVSRTDASNVVLDRTPGTGSGGTGTVGGALASPGGLGYALNNSGGGVAGWMAWIKGGTTYNYSTATVNVSGGPLDLYGSGSGAVYNKIFTMQAYSTTRGDGGTCSISANSTASIAAMIYAGGNSSGSHVMCGMIVDCTNTAGSLGGLYGFSATYNIFYNSSSDDSTGAGIRKVNARRCASTNSSGDGFNGCLATYSRANNNSGQGFDATSAVNCLSYSNTSHGYQSNGVVVTDSVAYGNGGDGFYHNLATRHQGWENCISYGNTGYGFGRGSGVDADLLVNCALGSNTGGDFRHGQPSITSGVITLTADPFTNAAGGDFSLNSTAGGGLLCRSAGITLFGQTQSDNQDVGPIQHADTGGGGGGTTGRQALHAIESGGV